MKPKADPFSARKIRVSKIRFRRVEDRHKPVSRRNPAADTVAIRYVDNGRGVPLHKGNIMKYTEGALSSSYELAEEFAIRCLPGISMIV